jgi:uncharacterized protein YndB with AHSA1/START domain
MPDILHRVGINVPAGRVFEALSTVEGLRHWWTTETTGNPKQGGKIDFGFCAMNVLESRPDELVHWKCMRGPEDWIGTEVSFQLIQKDHQTFVLFKHAHWEEPVEFMHHCSTKWATFLLSLRDWLERNEGRPAPYDVKIHVGD